MRNIDNSDKEKNIRNAVKPCLVGEEFGLALIELTFFFRPSLKRVLLTEITMIYLYNMSFWKLKSS